MSRKILGTRKEIYSDSDIAITVTDLYKSFRLPTERAFGLKQAIFNRLRGIKGYKTQKVLNGISFKVKKGEFIGIDSRRHLLSRKRQYHYRWQSYSFH